MEEAVVQAIVGGTIEAVFQNLIKVSREETKLDDQYFRKDLEKLRRTFTMIQSMLDHAEMQQVTDRPVKQWLKKLEDVAFKADNVLDELNYELLLKNMDIKTRMKKKMRSIFSRSNPRAQLCQKIRDINKDLEIINQEANNFGIQARFAGAQAPGAGSDAHAALETDSFTVDPIFLGRDKDVSRIVKMLTSCPNEEKFSILPIVGMAGLGKTTLAQKVYHDQKIRTHFQKHIWVHVSANFDLMIVFKKILTSLRSTNAEVGSKEDHLRELQGALGAKTYLLVLDDVWNQDPFKWQDFINSLSGISSTKGNGIIVTTRNLEVASIMQTLPIHELVSLTDDNCWSIIKAKAFGKSDIPLGYDTVGKNIAKRCGGLPLAAKVIGGLLHRKSKDYWLSFEKNWLSDFGGHGNTVLEILKLSFDNLSSPSLKKCFAYCSIFPKGLEIEREQLIELWMAEGFLQPDPRSDMETVGHKFFDLLVNNSLLQVVKTDGYGNITHCNMHDLVHDLACSVLGSKVNDNNLDNLYQVRYIGREYVGDESSRIPEEQAKYLRTLFFKGKISDDMFSNFESLHVLTLMGFHVEELPSSIGKLIHLRCLDITYTSIACLPDSIGELHHFQTLRAELNLKKLPSTLKYLISLRHLHISKIELPPRMGRLTSLQTLKYFRVGHEKGHGIEELGSLKNLKGELEIYNLEKVRCKEEATRANLFQKPNIVKLKFIWRQYRDGEINDENVLEGLQPHPHLKSLEIYGYKGKNFPLWTIKMAVKDALDGSWVGLDNLIEIRLTDCKECEEIPMLGHLPQLKSLYLSGLTNVRSIGSSFYGIDNCGVCEETIIVFPALERLELSNMSNLSEWKEVEFPSASETQKQHQMVVFPCLKYLEVTNCRQLKSAPSHFPCLQTMKIEYMCSALPLSSICGLELHGMEHWDSLPNQLQHLTGLQWLELNSFQIEALPEWFGNLRSLKKLTLSHCKKLRHLPSMESMRCLTKLTRLDIRDCPLLQQRCTEKQSDDDSEWPKISHIPDIYVDWRQIPSHGHEMQKQGSQQAGSSAPTA